MKLDELTIYMDKKSTLGPQMVFIKLILFDKKYFLS